MRKWIYTTLGHLGTVTTAIDGDTIEAESGTEFYVASEVDARIAKLQHAWEVERMTNAPKGDLVRRSPQPGASR